MRRRLFTLAAGVSAVLGVLVALAWVESRLRPRRWQTPGSTEWHEWSDGVFVRTGGPRGSLHVKVRNLAVPLLILPSVWAGRRFWNRRRQQQEGNFCPACGYDLRATPGRCPECGAVPAAAATPKGAA